MVLSKSKSAKFMPTVNARVAFPPGRAAAATRRTNAYECGRVRLALPSVVACVLRISFATNTSCREQLPRAQLAMKVEIENQLQKRVAVVHHRGSYATISQAFSRLGALAGKAGLFETPVAAMVGIYYDDPTTTPAAELRSDAGLVVPS